MPFIILGSLVLGFLLLIIGHVNSKNEDNNVVSDTTSSYSSSDFDDDFDGGFSGGGGW